MADTPKITFDSRQISTDDAKVRSLYGDTNLNSPVLSDAQVTWALSTETTTTFPGLLLVAATCADLCAARFAPDVDRSGQGMNTTRSQKFTHYKDLARDLRAQAEDKIARGDLTDDAGLFLGGVSQNDADDLTNDSDYIRHSHERGQFDNDST